jgi:ligand-binding sensor domain-containing protein
MQEDAVAVTKGDQQTEPMVANPRRQRLESLLSAVRAQAGALASALDKGAQDMGGGRVWTGTTAGAFQQEIEGRKQRLHSQAGKLEGIVNDALASEPEKITASEARAQHHNDF